MTNFSTFIGIVGTLFSIVLALITIAEKRNISKKVFGSLIVILAFIIISGVIFSILATITVPPAKEGTTTNQSIQSSNATKVVPIPTQRPSPASTSASTSSSTSTTSDSGYHSDFCNRKNEWSSSSWIVSDCALYSSDQGSDPLTVPYIPKTSDYRVEITAQVLNPSSCYQGIYIQVRVDENNSQGYTGGYTCNQGAETYTKLGLSPTLDIPTHYYIDWSLVPYSAGGNPFSMIMTVKGTHVSLAVNGNVYIDKQYTSANSAGTILLTADRTAIKVTKVVVTPV